MGKNKPKKDILKVAGAQSLKVKSKAKAKPVKLNLKQLAPKLKNKTLELDAQLVEVRPLLTQKPKEEKPVNKPRPTPQIVISQPPLTQEDENNALDRLNELQCK